MGIYLSSPKTEKFSEDGGNPRLRFGLSSMQGWRASMEDAVELCDDDDFLILACDGVWDCMSNQQLVDFINEQIETVSIYSLITFKQT
ncbi:hypothetical protein BHE74_00034563 [Ensete ventricosum]|nr:hypothetical protein BHE74_00034563 [Ensete ventricosum]